MLKFPNFGRFEYSYSQIIDRSRFENFEARTPRSFEIVNRWNYQSLDSQLSKFPIFEILERPVPIFSGVQIDKLANSPTSILQDQFQRNLTLDPLIKKLPKNQQE